METPQHACRWSRASPSSGMDRRGQRVTGVAQTGSHAALDAASAPCAKRRHIHGRNSGRITPLSARAGSMAACGARVGGHSRGPPPILIRKFHFVAQCWQEAGLTEIFA